MPALSSIFPLTAPEAIQLTVLDCLGRRDGHGFHPDALRFLNLIDFRANNLVVDLIEDLSRYHLFLKAKNRPSDLQKYQFVMRYDDETLLIHVTLSVRETEPPSLRLAVHRHNIPGPPLPLPLLPLPSTS